jgi:hypothetical protein
MSKFPLLLGAAAVVGLMASYPAQAQMSFRYNGPAESPQMNNIRSAHYDRLLETSRGFRAYRMRKECNPIDFVQNLRQDCFASFDQYEPFAGR